MQYVTVMSWLWRHQHSLRLKIIQMMIVEMINILAGPHTKVPASICFQIDQTSPLLTKKTSRKLYLAYDQITEFILKI